MSGFTLRPFQSDDYADVVNLRNSADLSFRFSVEELQSRDARRQPGMLFARRVAVDSAGQVVGVSEYDQRPDMYHPRKWQAHVYVHPDVQGRGIGTQLLDRVEQELQEHQVISIRTFTSETRPRDVTFLLRRGFREYLRDGAATLDLTTVEVSLAMEYEANAQAQGVTFRTLTELALDLERDIKLCRLHNALIADIPPLGERTPLDVQTFRQMQILRADNIPDAHMVAVTRDGEYIGVSSLRVPPNRNPQERFVGITGVVRSWRNRGIALGLKWQAMRYAKDAGVQYLKTWNAVNNEPVLALNRKLGFVREPWRIHFIKEFHSEDRP